MATAYPFKRRPSSPTKAQIPWETSRRVYDGATKSRAQRAGPGPHPVEKASEYLGSYNEKPVNITYPEFPTGGHHETVSPPGKRCFRAIHATGTSASTEAPGPRRCFPAQKASSYSICSQTAGHPRGGYQEAGAVGPRRTAYAQPCHNVIASQAPSVDYGYSIRGGLAQPASIRTNPRMNASSIVFGSDPRL
eukprot:NODE_2038_length_845_cov_272.110553_g1431_i0.p2 GENE.NODE_2038_length_845_cov_272.110553_g1431_i0~~NODE_2038_length_845_cov_272.110553_g1431_i0.p2  ORF type:complete len:192 (+),score=59.59 NODE_2038_length_845_cov_272.110553_g1431_i0:65-640(+)